MNYKTITKWFSALLLMVGGVSSAFAQNITVDPIEINADETKTIAVRLSNNDATVLGFQTDIVIPEGFVLAGEPTAKEGVMVTPKGEPANAVVSYNVVDENTIRVIVFAEDAMGDADDIYAFNEKADTVLFFDLTSPANFTGVANLGLTNIRVTNLNADNSMKDVKLADQDVFVSTFSFTSGKYLLQNMESGLFLAAANNWGTQASLVAAPEWVNLINLGDGTYNIDTQVNNGGESHYFRFMDDGTLFMDQTPATALNIKRFFDENDNAYFTIGKGESLIGYSGTDGVVVKDLTEDNPNAFWQIISINGEDSAKYLATATVDQPLNATWLIQDANFGRNNRNVSAWNVSEDCTNKNLSGGNNTNNNAESFHSTFTISQSFKAPKGIYRLSAQGFYRQDGSDVENLPVIFIGEQTTAIPEKTGTENSMSDASVSFSAGLYQVEPILFEQPVDGDITVGVKLAENTNLWVIWDNFQLEYFGDVSMADVLFGDKAKEVATLVDEALALLASDFLTDEAAAAEKAALQDAVKNSRSLPATEEAYDKAIAELQAAITAGRAVIASNLVLIKAAKNAQIDALAPVGNGLFEYAQADIDAAKAAVDAATSVEAIEAVEMPKVKAPKAGEAYYLTLATSEGTYYMSMSDGIKITEESEGIYFVAQEDGTFALSDGSEYINYEGSNNWTMTASADAYGWTIAPAENGYTIKGKNGLLGTNTSDGNGANSPLYGDKKPENGNVYWQIEVSGPETVLAEEAVLENWTREFTGEGEDGSFVLNTWSTEDDASGIKTPFIETWVWGGNGAQLSNEKIYRTIENLKPGAYQVNLLLRAYNEMAGSSAPSGVKISANDASVDISEGQEFSYNNMAGIYDNFTLTTTVGEDGKLDVAVEVYDSNVSWIAFKNLEVIYCGSEAPKDKWFTDGKITFKVNDYPDAVNKNAVADARWDGANGCIIVTSNDNPSNDYDAQLFIVLPDKLVEGDELTLTMKVKADRAQNGCGAQAHSEPGQYNHWQCVDAINFTTEWVDYNSSITVSAAMEKGDNGNGSKDGMTTIAFNLADMTNKTTNNFYFDDIVVGYTSAVRIADIEKASTKSNGKYFENGKVYIIKNGVKYNVGGVMVK